MTRTLPKGRGTDRKPGNRQPKTLFKIICEGKNTEPKYIACFAKAHGNNLIDIETIGAAGVPLTIVRKSVQAKKDLIKEAKKTGFERHIEVWAVFDVDEHPNLPQAINMANGNKIYVAQSNPCIEIWPLLHLEFQRAPIHRHALQKKLAQYMDSYKKNGSKIIDYNQIKNNYKEAKQRAEQIMTEHKQVGDELANPSTDIFKLLDGIIKHGKQKKTN